MNSSIEKLVDNLSSHFHNNQKLMTEFTIDEINNLKTTDNLKRLKKLFPEDRINNDFICPLLDGYNKGFKTVDELRKDTERKLRASIIKTHRTQGKADANLNSFR